MRLAGVKGPGPERRRRFSTLTLRILMPNVLPLVVLVGGIFYLDQYRDGLLDAKIAAMQSQAEVIAGALGESALVGPEGRRRLERNTAARIIRRLVVPTNTRARLYLPNGGLLADSRELVAAGRQVQLRYLPPADPSDRVLRFFNRIYDWLLPRLPSGPAFPPYRERLGSGMIDYPELGVALGGEVGGAIRTFKGETLILSVAVPVQQLRRVVGGLLLSANSADIEEGVRNARLAILQASALALTVTVLMSFFLAGTIAGPVRRLAAAADRVEALRVPEEAREIADHILGSVREALSTLGELGLGYLSLDRRARSLSAGELQRQEVLSAQVNRMLDSELTKRFCDSFPAQWLQLEQIVSATPDPKLFPEYYFAKYNAGMNLMAEPLLLFETVLVEDLSILQFIDSDFSYRSPMLTTWYDAAKPVAFHGPGALVFKRVPITDRRQGGIFTNAAIMTMTSRSDQTQPITRGAWVATVILNDPPEPPPADVPLLQKVDDPANELSIKEKFAAHQENASCASCHRKIDPLGFVLENYNPVGFWRDEYRDGKPVESNGVLLGQHAFSNIVEFKDALLLEKDRFTSALAKHLLTYALGRRLDYRDVLAVEGIVRETAKSEYRLRALLREVVLSEAFSGSKRKLVTK